MSAVGRDLGHWLIAQEARALLTRLDRVKVLALQETMVGAARPAQDASIAIERYLVQGRAALRARVLSFIEWLEGPGMRARPEEAHRRLVFLKLSFNTVLTQLDIFSEALSQRSEAETGVWLAGLDAAARDALALPGYIDPPPLVCYLARDPGGAIRRARTRLPGGGENPVAIIRLPRERMIGAGIASSLVHEVAHQAAAQLELVPVLQSALESRPAPSFLGRRLDGHFQRWLPEIVADIWAIARVGVASTLGLISLVSLPRTFVFRRALTDDPHPPPWIRVKLSCAIGEAIYPHPQWQDIAQTWESFYPLAGLPESQVHTLRAFERAMPSTADRLLTANVPALRGRTLADVLEQPALRTTSLRMLMTRTRGSPRLLKSLSPTLAFAVIGQARASGVMTPKDEGQLLSELLKHWALCHVLGRELARGATEPQTRVVSARPARSASLTTLSI